MTRTPARTKAKELAKFLRTERPDYAYLKSVFRELRKEREIEVERPSARLPEVPTGEAQPVYEQTIGTFPIQ